jgi:hypothetical protein
MTPSNQMGCGTLWSRQIRWTLVLSDQMGVWHTVTPSDQMGLGHMWPPSDQMGVWHTDPIRSDGGVAHVGTEAPSDEVTGCGTCCRHITLDEDVA